MCVALINYCGYFTFAAIWKICWMNILLLFRYSSLNFQKPQQTVDPAPIKKQITSIFLYPLIVIIHLPKDHIYSDFSWLRLVLPVFMFYINEIIQCFWVLCLASRIQPESCEIPPHCCIWTVGYSFFLQYSILLWSSGSFYYGIVSIFPVIYILVYSGYIRALSLCWFLFFLSPFLFLKYLAVPGLICGMQDLISSLWHVGSSSLTQDRT